VSFRSGLAQSVYDFLDVGKSPHPADAIFVLPGNQETRIHGFRMWRFGYAPQLILSVSAPEGKKIEELNLESDGLLEEVTGQMPAGNSHYLFRIGRGGASCTPLRKMRSEAGALKEHLPDVRTLLVVAQPVQLRRAFTAFRRAFRRSGIQLTFVAVPEKISFASPSVRSEVWSEFGKYLRCLLLRF
jgi:hypothetical protein